MKHLTKRPDGRYCCWYKGRAFYGKTEREALRIRDEYKYQCEHGVDEIRPITVKEYASEWLPSSKASVSAKCYNDYAKQLDKLIDVCGDKLMNSVTPADIKKIWRGFVGMSDSTIHRARMIYRALFHSAQENGYCKRNPVEADSARPHKGTEGTHRAITEEERYLIEHTPHRAQAAAMTMLYAGLRRGEVLSLSTDDIYDGMIHVTDAVRYVGNKAVVTNPKTKTSIRSIPILDKLKPFLDQCDGLIMPAPRGGICSETTFSEQWKSYNKALSAVAGHPINIRCHDLRHSFATWLRDNEVDLHTAIILLGHSDEKMILQIYDHVSEKRISDVFSKLNKSNTSQPIKKEA